MRWLVSVAVMIWSCVALAQEEAPIAAQVIAGQRGYELPIEITNRNKDAISNLRVNAADVPVGIANLRIEAYKLQAAQNPGPYGIQAERVDAPSGIERLAPGETSYFTVHFDVTLDAPAVDDALLKFNVTAGEVPFDNPHPAIALTILNPAAAELYYKLVRVETLSALEDEKTTSGVIRGRFDAGTASFVWTKDTTGNSRAKPGAGRFDLGTSYGHDARQYNSVETQSLGFQEYPQKIILGEPFTFSASVITQRDVFPGQCWTAEQQTLKFHAGIKVLGGVNFTQAVPYRIADCQGRRSNQTVHAGGMIHLSVNCTPIAREVKPISISSARHGALRHKYGCRAVSADGEKAPGRDQWEIDLDLLFKIDSHNNPILNMAGQYIFEVPDHIGRAANVLVDLATSHGSIAPVRLVYEPMSSATQMLQGTRPVQHPIAVNNSVEGGAPEERVAGENGRGQDEIGDRRNPPGSGGGRVSNEQDLVRAKDRRRTHIEHWLNHAIPAENALPGYSLSYDPWGRVQGKAPNGTISLTRKPDSAGLDPTDYAWARADALDSLNLCTLKEYVTRQLAEQETESCLRKRPEEQQTRTNNVPDFVGLEAAKAKADLEKLGLKVRWRAGSIAEDARQQSLVEKQQPAAGSSLKNLKEVELWVYRYAAKPVAVPNVIGLSFDEAAAKLRAVGLTAVKGEERSVLTLASVGKVMGQSPGARGTAQAGTDVTLAIGARISSPDSFSFGSLNRGSGKTPQNTSVTRERINQNWAGTWHVDRQYLMELTVAGNRVTGRYGTNLEKTLEGTISGNTLTGQWQEVQTGRFNRTLYGQFQNTLSEDGNSWSGNWNMMKTELGGWNGSWSAVRVAKTKPPEPPNTQTPPNRSLAEFQCDAGTGNMSYQTQKTHWSARGDKSKEGNTWVVASQAHNYGCGYEYRGISQSVTVSFYKSYPTTAAGKKSFKETCASETSRRLAGGKAVNVWLGHPTYELVGDKDSTIHKGDAQTLARFHVNQVAKLAVSCR